MIFAPGLVSGSIGCNYYRGSVSQGESATSLVIGPLTSTGIARPEPIATWERAYLELLASAKVFQFRFGELGLSGAKGNMTFSAGSD